MKKSLKKLTAMLTATAMVSCSMVSGMVSAANVDKPAEMKSAKMISSLPMQSLINADVDFDGQVTAMDVNLIQKSVIGLVKFEVSADSGILPGDVNLDGLVNMMDCVVLNKFLIGENISNSYTSEDKVEIVPVSREISVSPLENNKIYADFTISNINGGISGMKAKIDIDAGFDIADVDGDSGLIWNESNNEISMFSYKPTNEFVLYIDVTADSFIDSGLYTLSLADIEIIDAEGALVSDANISAKPVNIRVEEPVFMTTTTAPMVTTTTTEPVDYTTTTTETTADTTFTTPLPSTTVTTDSSNDYINISFGDYVASPGSEVNVSVYMESFNNPVAGVDAAFTLDSPLTLSRIGSSSPACYDASVLTNVDENTACFTCLNGATPIVPAASEPLFILRVRVPAGCPDGIYSIGFDKCSVIKDGTSFEYNTRISNGSIMVVGESIDYPPASTTTEPIDYTTTTTTTTTEPVDYTTTTTTTEPIDYTTTTTTTEPIDYTTTSYSDSTTVSYYPDYTETTANTTASDYTATETTTTDMLGSTATETTANTTAPDYTATETTTTDMLGSTATETTANTTEPDYTATETTTTVPMDTTTTNDINDVSTTTTASEEPVTPEASATTTAAPSDDLPQTGMPIARAVEGLAVLLTISGTALIVKSRKDSDET